MLMRLNSSKQPQAPVCTRPEKVRASESTVMWSEQLNTATCRPRFLPRSFTVSVLPVPAGPCGQPPSARTRQARKRHAAAAAVRTAAQVEGGGERHVAAVRERRDDEAAVVALVLVAVAEGRVGLLDHALTKVALVAVPVVAQLRDPLEARDLHRPCVSGTPLAPAVRCAAADVRLPSRAT
jgi:hypothetical protein